MMYRCLSHLLLLCLVLVAAAGPATKPAGAPSREGMVRIPGGTFVMGTNEGFPYEGPEHEVTVKPFWMDKTEVTVGQFERFVKETGYKTEAETIGWSGVFDPAQQAWTKSDGADWRHPHGPQSAAKPDEPVVHISIADAKAYAAWAGKRLPTEAEFEFAARGGLVGKRYPWGDELTPGGKHVTNVWQGIFPRSDRGEDKFPGLAPVGSFAPNGYGLYDISGNVWEWTADFYDPTYYQRSPKDNPTGSEKGPEHTIRGGSWLCSDNYCTGYRVASRMHTAPDSGLNNLGFRCVADE